MKILSIQVGKPKLVTYRGHEVSTGIFKDPVQGSVWLRTLNLEGDGQADLKVHGGRDKALYAYSYDTYTEWKKLRPKDVLPYGAFGENLCIDSLPESQIFLGDVYEVGSARIQVTQPRFPCQKLVVKFQDPLILKQFIQLGRSGVYYRVLQEGQIEAGQEMKLVEKAHVRVSVQEIFEISKPTDDAGRARVREILGLKSLNENWREKFQAWLS